MKFAIGAALLLAALLGNGVAVAATVDEVKWIIQCIHDNEDEAQPEDVVLTYCTCMNNKMGANDSQSITEWEKTHEAEADVCTERAGWK